MRLNIALPSNNDFAIIKLLFRHLRATHHSFRTKLTITRNFYCKLDSSRNGETVMIDWASAVQTALPMH